MKIPVEISVCKEWIKRWDIIDEDLVKLHKKMYKKKDKWDYLVGHVIHDGRRNQTKLKLALGSDYDGAVRHKIWGVFSNFVVFAEYMLDKEK